MQLLNRVGVYIEHRSIIQNVEMLFRVKKGVFYRVKTSIEQELVI